MNVSKWLRVIVLGVVSFCLPGCWDYVKINDRAQIIGIGVDPAGEGSKELTFTFQVPVFGRDQPQGKDSQTSSSTQFRNFTVKAKAVSDAIAHTQLQYNKTFYLGNLQTIVLNRQLKGPQIRHVIAELIRTPTTDKLSWVTFSNEAASSLLESKGGDEPPADTIDRFLSSSLKQQGFTTRTRLWEYWCALQTPGIEPHVGLVGFSHEQLAVSGMLSFHHLVPSVELSPNETLYYNFVSGQVRRITMVIQNGARSFETGDVSAHSTLSVTFEHGIPTLHVQIRAQCILLQDESDEPEALTDLMLLRYEKVMSDQIRQGCTRVIRQFQDRKTDVFGFGEYAYTHNVARKADVENRWETMFAEAKQDVTVDVAILRKGSLM